MFSLQIEITILWNEDGAFQLSQSHHQTEFVVHHT
jgi:hypothetical protein